jgi:hypothetical protein
VDHPACRQLAGGGRLRIAGRAPAERAAFLEDRRPARVVDRAVDPAAAEQRRVGRVDDRVDVLTRDVAADELESTAA